MSSNLITLPSTNLSDLVDCYNSTITTLLNKHAPLKFTPALNKLKLTERHLERASCTSTSIIPSKILNFYVLPQIIIMLLSSKLKESKTVSLIASSFNNPRHLWHNVNKILRRTSSPVLSSCDPVGSLSQSFATFFSDKIHKHHAGLISNRARTSLHIYSSSFYTS